jgi:hypothetical protein
MFTMCSKPVDRMPTMIPTMSLPHLSRLPAGSAATPTEPSVRLALPLRPATPRPIAARPAMAGTIPFATAAEAWFWTLRALAARHAGSSRGGPRIPRPCDPDDVIRAIDLLHRRGGLGLHHARILRRWGDIGHAPNPASPAEHPDSLLWEEALERLEGLLRAKGIVGTTPA